MRKYLCILVINRGREGGQGAKLDRRRRKRGRDGLRPTDVSQRGWVLASKEGNPEPLRTNAGNGPEELGEGRRSHLPPSVRNLGHRSAQRISSPAWRGFLSPEERVHMELIKINNFSVSVHGSPHYPLQHGFQVAPLLQEALLLPLSLLGNLRRLLLQGQQSLLEDERIKLVTSLQSPYKTWHVTQSYITGHVYMQTV